MKKICPLMSGPWVDTATAEWPLSATHFVECQKECAWWFNLEGRCIIVSFAERGAG